MAVTVILEPEGFDTYAVRAGTGKLLGFIGWAAVHKRWHAFDKVGTFLDAETSRSRAAELVASGE